MNNIREILEPFTKIDKDIIKLWETQRSLLKRICSFGNWQFNNINDFNNEMCMWKQLYKKVFGDIVTAPYIHIFVIHIPQFLQLYGALGKFSMQALENKNKKIKQYYKKTNFRFQINNDWRHQILRIDWLRLKVLFTNKKKLVLGLMNHIYPKRKRF